jgi:hypothetical protein
MTSARRFRWLPRFSLSNLLMLMVVVGLCLAWCDQRRRLGEQAEVIDGLWLENRRLTVIHIVRDPSSSDALKAIRLNRYIKVGDGEAEIEKWCGEPEDRYVVGSTSRATYLMDCLMITCRDGRVRDFGYYTNVQPEVGTLGPGLGFVSLSGRSERR